jgi:hypothetical protein
MPREYNIQDRTRQKLAELNKRVSNKKSRYRTGKGIELSPLIQTKNPSEFTSRKEVEKYIRDMERFIDRKTQYVQNDKKNIFTTESVKKYYKEIDRINKIKEKEYNRVHMLETQIKGEKLGSTVAESIRFGGQNLFPNLKPLTGSLNRFSSEQELLQTVENRFKKGYFRGNFIKRADRQYKENYIQSLETAFGSKSAHLQKAFKKMTLNDFMKVYYETLGEVDIEYNYDDTEIADTRINTIERSFNV